MLGNTSRDVPFYYSQAHCVMDIVRSCGARWTARYHAVRDMMMSITQCAREHQSGCAILLLPSTLCDGHREITRCVMDITQCEVDGQRDNPGVTDREISRGV